MKDNMTTSLMQSTLKKVLNEYKQVLLNSIHTLNLKDSMNEIPYATWKFLYEQQERSFRDLNRIMEELPQYFHNCEHNSSDTAEQKLKFVSSLTNDALIDLTWNTENSMEIYRKIANAAAQRAVEELKMPDMPWITHNCDEWDSRITFIEGIKRYLRDLKEGKL